MATTTRTQHRRSVLAAAVLAVLGAASVVVPAAAVAAPVAAPVAGPVSGETTRGGHTWDRVTRGGHTWDRVLRGGHTWDGHAPWRAHAQDEPTT